MPPNLEILYQENLCETCIFRRVDCRSSYRADYACISVQRGPCQCPRSSGRSARCAYARSASIRAKSHFDTYAKSNIYTATTSTPVSDLDVIAMQMAVISGKDDSVTRQRFKFLIPRFVEICPEMPNSDREHSTIW